MASKFLPGNHEAEMCYGGEADLHKHVAGCEKNPGHKGFIPLKDFSISCLPSRYHGDNLMLETIKTLAALTVQVKTKFTSPKRPLFYPDSRVTYPCYHDRGSHVMRLGTGKVSKVVMYTDGFGCECSKCCERTNYTWGVIYVETATHVVFDDNESRQTTCVLGFDDNKSPVVSLDGWRLVEADVGRDRCVLSYVTCDIKLLNKLDQLSRYFDDLCGKVRKTYMRYVGVDNLTVIVSHPHGCPKQVSVGQWTHKRESYSWRTRYWYTTCTCPGSSGACVYRLGYDGLLIQLPHSGSNSEGNYSGEHLFCCNCQISPILKKNK